MTERRATVYAAALGAFGTLAAAVYAWVGPGSGDLTVAAAALGLGAVIGSLAPLRFKAQGGVRATTLDEAFLIAMLLVLSPRQAPVLLAAAAAVGNVVLGVGWTKTAFNAGAVALSATAGALAFAGVRGEGEMLSLEVTGAVLVAVLAYVAANQVLVAGLFRQLSGRPYVSMLADTWRLDALSLGANVALGFPLAILAARMPLLGLLFSLFIAGIYFASRSYARAIQERQRTRVLHEVTRLLADAASAPDAVGTFLERTREVFRAESAELFLLGADGPTLLCWVDGALATSAVEPPAHGPLAEVLRTKQSAYVSAEGRRVGQALAQSGHRDGLLAPLLHEGRTVGVLAVYDRHGLEPWDDADANILSALADEAAVAVRNIELFESIELEKSKLAEETRKLSDVMEAASDGIAFIDSDGMVETWNRAMEGITGISTEEAHGRPWFMSLRLRDGQGEDLPIDGPGPLRTALAGDQPKTPLDVQILRRDGRWRWLRASVAPVVREGAVAGVVLIARDATTERETEELKADFVSTVSHELRTPLTPLKGFIITAAERWDELPPEQVRQMLTSMLRQVERLETLVGDLLVFAELDRGSARLREQIVELDLLVRTAVGSEMRPLTSRRILLERLEPCRVVADPSAVARIVRALVDNALKHTGGSITISLHKDGEEAVVSVADEGAGISDADRERIFAPFSRLGHHLTRSTQGPGLGLAIARNLTDRLGGRLEVSSEIGVGSIFRLCLPLPVATAQPEAHPSDVEV